MYIRGFIKYKNSKQAFNIAYREWSLSEHEDFKQTRHSSPWVLYDAMSELCKLSNNEDLAKYERDIYFCPMGTGISPSLTVRRHLFYQTQNFVPELIYNDKHDSKVKLDLHGKNKEESIELVTEHLKQMALAKVRPKLLIITGKGNHSSGGPVLKPAIEEILKNCKNIFKFEFCLNIEGGAFHVWPKGTAK